MLSSESAIHRFRRDITLGALLRLALLAGAMAAIAINWFPNIKFDGTLVLIVIGGVWMVLSYRSVKGTRLAAESPLLIAAGNFDAAEQQIEQALRSFSLFRSAKVLSLHHLALLRHAQRRWQDSALLSKTLLGQRLGAMQSITKPTRLLLADALLELGDVPGAYHALTDLYRDRLSLGESMNLLLVQLDYEAKIGAWESMLPPGGAYRRTQLAELMPAPSAARAQAMMALAAKKLGRKDWADWLSYRAALLTDPAELVAERPILSELFATAAPVVDGTASAAVNIPSAKAESTRNVI